MMIFACVAGLLGNTQVQASEFNSGYIGAKIGYNKNTPISKNSSNKIYPGVELGYTRDVGKVVLGVDAFLDSHPESITGKDYGADIKFGIPLGNFMPFLKLGSAGSAPGPRTHAGIGFEYKFSRDFSIVLEGTTDNYTKFKVDRENRNVSLGINYYFDVYREPPPVVAPVIVKAPEPEPEPEPVVIIEKVYVPAPPPEPVKERIFVDKPVTIEGANFDSGSAVLKSASFAQLDEVVEFAKMNPASYLAVVGHTDSTGNQNLNMRLSLRRAQSVKSYLVRHGVDASRITTQGKGSANPIADNETKAGRALNRRVEIDTVQRVEQ